MTHTPCHWPFNPAQDPYAVIVGRGRSGTNMALDILDTHPRTLCRNEANRIAGAALNALPLDFENTRAESWSLEAWRTALQISAVCHGARDRSRRDYKSYYASAPGRMICEHALPRQKLRRALKTTGLLPQVNEWRVDWAFARQPEQLPQLPVLKILTQPHWILRTHDADPGQHVIHMIRAPQGFVASWLNRYVAPRGSEKVFADNLATLDVILEALGGRLHSGRTFSEAALIESELWRWRYMNETVFSALSGSDRYKLWHYEDALNAPAQKGAEAMGWLGLEIDEATQTRMSQMENTLFAKPHARKIDNAQTADLAATVLDGSPMADWFTQS